ncbi:MAG TPA: hypothetical protein VJG31_03915 [Candidatus Nanoarchaeia archaeon]|nr:hypothetical protein [Candidatus Nanoarchaeia archaeon]
MGKVKVGDTIEEIIQKHVETMKSIKGNKDYTFEKMDLIMHLASIEAKARSPPVIMQKTYKKMILGTVFGNESKPNTDYGPED